MPQLSFPHLDCYISIKLTPQALQSKQCVAFRATLETKCFYLSTFKTDTTEVLLHNSKTRTITFGKHRVCKQERNFIGQITFRVLAYLTIFIHKQIFKNGCWHYVCLLHSEVTEWYYFHFTYYVFFFICVHVVFNTSRIECICL